MNSYLRPFRGCWDWWNIAYYQCMWCKHWLCHEFWAMASLEAGFKIYLCGLEPKIPKSRCGWGLCWGCLEFINDNVGYFEVTHVGINHKSMNDLSLHLEAAWPPTKPTFYVRSTYVWGWVAEATLEAEPSHIRFRYSKSCSFRLNIQKLPT